MDYQKLGFRCGLEIHRQLDTKTKLFCACKSRLSPDKPAGTVVRKLRPVVGETGDIDVAALHETLKGKEFCYLVYTWESCEVELDEEPPHPVNMEALRTAMTIAKALNCFIPDEIEVMRKIVLDGSNTSGFQRTAVVGVDGWMETSAGRIGIENVSLEEEACQIVKKERKRVYYGLDRLGIPLAEISTSSDIKSPEHSKEVAGKIGMILKSTEKVKSGIGTIRQDLNVSISGGTRVEIKGVQNLNQIPDIVRKEIDRQKGIIARGGTVSKDVRKPLVNGETEFLRPLPGSARLYPETDIEPIQVSAELLRSLRIPRFLDERFRDLEKLGLNQELAQAALEIQGFEELAKRFPRVNPALIVRVLVLIPRDLKSRLGLETRQIKMEGLLKVLKLMDEGKIGKEAIQGIVEELAKNPQSAIAIPQGLSEEGVREIVQRAVREKASILQMQNPEQVFMGIVMRELRGKADGSLVMRIVREEVRARKLKG